MEYLVWFEATSFSTWMRESGPAFFSSLILHSVAMGFAVGIHVAADLRILGVAPRVPLSLMKRFSSVLWGMMVGKLALVESLLAHGADPHARLAKPPPHFGFSSGRFRVSLVGATPFLLTAMDANLEVMRALDAAGADVYEGTDENTTPLMVAAGLGQVPAETRVTATEAFDAVEYLLKRGAYVDAVNARGRTALHGAAHIRSDAIVQLLVDHGASISVADEKGITPLMIAEGGGHVLLPGLGGGSTADLLRALGGTETSSDLITIYDKGKIR